MIVYVVYTRFVDDTAEVDGIFASAEAAAEAIFHLNAKEPNNLRCSQEFKLDELLEKPIALE